MTDIKSDNYQKHYLQSLLFYALSNCWVWEELPKCSDYLLFIHKETGAEVALAVAARHTRSLSASKAALTKALNIAIGSRKIKPVIVDDEVPTPTTYFEDRWIYSGELPTDADPDYIGKWQIFSKPMQVDDDWKRIVDAIEDGHLVARAKVSTILGYVPSAGVHVICVYTTDYRDEADVWRCREQLGVRVAAEQKT